MRIFDLLKRALFVAAALVVAVGGISFADPTPPPFPLQYWVIGKLNPPESIPANFNLAGYKVVLYTTDGDPSKGYAAGTTDKDGNFMINPYDDARFNPEAGKDYYIGVVAKLGYGLNQKIQQLNLQGYTEVTLGPLTLEAGVPDPDPGATIPAGTVPLFISRDANGLDINITWEATKQDYDKLQIYMLTGDGTGAFTNSFVTGNPPNWIKVVEKGGLIAGMEKDFAYDNIKGKLTHTNQIATGNTEVYYKAVQANVTNIIQLPGSSTFASALAVGKMNYQLKKGLENFLAFTLIQSDKSPAAVLGKKGFEANDFLLTYDGGWPTCTFTGLAWDGGIGAISETAGYWIGVQTPKVLTVVGAVNNLSQQYTLKPGLENLLAIPYPSTLDLTDASGNDKLGLGTLGDGTIVTSYNGSWPTTIFSGGKWDQGYPKLKAGKAFWLSSPKADSFPWNLNKPY